MGAMVAVAPFAKCRVTRSAAACTVLAFTGPVRVCHPVIPRPVLPRQDNYDVSLLPPVESDDVSHDLPPIMLTDSDMDPNMRMLLEWRVGTKVDKAKEMGMVTRCALAAGGRGRGRYGSC